VEAVEMDPIKRGTLLKNVAMSPIRIRCHFMSAELYVRRAKRSFNVVFCDPPFPYRYKQQLTTSIGQSPLMEKGSLLLIHRPKEDRFDDVLGSLALEDRRIYGRSVVDFYRHNGDI
jgi:16S rRNA G966 N2-methylase RsmD